MKLAIWTRLVVGFVLALLMAAPAFASLSEGFSTTESIPTGSLVALDSGSANTVVPANVNNVSRLFGVVVPESSASISLSGSGASQVQVVTSGTAYVLVSTEGGGISVGDYISASAISGIGQKVGQSSARVVGTAQSDFTGSESGDSKQQVTDSSGHQSQVSIGEIPVAIDVSTYTSTQGVQNYAVPNWLQNLSNTLAGKAVSPIRVIIAGLILIVALISISVLIYSAVRNSIISIGRNPLSRGSVLKGLLQVMVIAVIILALASVVIYLVLAR